MKLEVNGIRVEVSESELERGVALTIDGKTFMLAAVARPVPAKVEAPPSAPKPHGYSYSAYHYDSHVTADERAHYELDFTSDRLKNKIGAIKVVRQFLGLGLAEAKALVEGQKTLTINGPRWDLSNFCKELTEVTNDNDFRVTYTKYPRCEIPYTYT